MSKRSFTDLSCSDTGTLPPTSDTSTAVHRSHFSTTTNNHYIRQTFLGPICTKCNTKVACLGTLFTISSKTIIRHWKKNNCYLGDIKNLNAKEVERSLHMSIVQLYNSIHHNPTLASKIVSTQLYSITATTTSPYCSRCGYVGKSNNLRRHTQSPTSTCTSADINDCGGKVLTNKFQFRIPQQVLDSISAGTFELPFDQHTNTIIVVDTSNNGDVHSTTSSSLLSPTFNHSTILMTPAKFLPSNVEIEDICSPDSILDDATSINTFAMSELVHCFGSDENAIMAREFLTSFILLICQKYPGSLRTSLYDISTMSSSSTTDLNLKLLLNAGKLWLISDSANIDVRMVPVHHRNAIYLVGNTFTEKDKDLLKGCTFVWTDCVDAILQQFLSLITYAYKSQWPIIQPYLDKVNHLYQLLLENNPTDLDIEELEELASAKIVNSTIICGLLSELLMEHPTKPNGPNCIYHYLAGVCVVPCTKTKTLSLRSANGISRSANACLRLLRHGVCSLYVRQSVLMTQEMKSDADFQAWVNDFLQQIQVSSSVGHICRTIRTARDVDRKTPSSVYKAFNDMTGDLVVDGNEVFKSSWSVAIPSACQEWDRHLLLLFPDHASSSSALPLHLVFNLNHHIVLAEEDSCIYIDNSSDSSIPLSEFKPSFPHANSHDAESVAATQNALNECWKYNLGCHAYFSSGAARGAEIKRLPEFPKSQLLWNSLTFELRSHKNMSHGKNFNEMVRHYLPPSTSRRSILWNLILLPALQRAGYHEPSDNHVNSALSDMFQKTMNLPAPVDTKVNRDFIAVLTDYIAPSGLAKTSTTSEMASQFHHSREIHDSFYSAERYRRDKDGNFIRGPLIMAHEIWKALGESFDCTTNARPEIENIILTKSHYDYAAKRAFKDHMATATDLQYEAIRHASSSEINKHAFVLMGCGTGKSGIYNLLLLGAYLNACPVPRIIVISPHNSLLSQHVLQSRQYLRGTNLRVSSMLPVDVTTTTNTSNFDLLFISVHAFNDLTTTHGRYILQTWNVTNIFIDEYHNIVGELFRYTSSWQSLRMLAATNIKIMCLSATADPTLMDNLSSFMCLDNYDVIGDKHKYPIPNVAIKMMSSVYNDESSSLIQSVVSHCRHLIEQKNHRQFKIHAITMSKDVATKLSDQLNISGMTSLWLTSDLQPEKKTQVLQLWQDGPEKVLVSTFVDGIDNSATEDVILVGGTHSIYSLVQAVGRIRPRRQDITHAAVHIFNSQQYLKAENYELEQQMSRLVGANIFPSSNNESSTKYYKRMFTVSGYLEFSLQPHCYRKVLYEHFDIQSKACQHCSNCKTRNNITKSAIIASRVVLQEEKNRSLVVEALTEMLTHCFLCKQPSCDGLKCFRGTNPCFACHGPSCARNFHSRKTCPAVHPQIATNSQSCSRCCLATSHYIPCRGTLRDHQQQNCPHKSRVKRVLLYGVENNCDRGKSAREILLSALPNHTVWFNKMATNIAMITSKR